MFTALYKLENSLVLFIRFKYFNKYLSEIIYIDNRPAGILFYEGRSINNKIKI